MLFGSTYTYFPFILAALATFNCFKSRESDYAKGKVWGNNLVFCALAGVLWYMQFFGLEMGKSFLTESPVLLAFSWCILMALNVTFSNVWGIILKEWKGVSNKTITVLIAGLIVLIFSLVFPNLF